MFWCPNAGLFCIGWMCVCVVEVIEELTGAVFNYEEWVLLGASVVIMVPMILPKVFFL